MTKKKKRTYTVPWTDRVCKLCKKNRLVARNKSGYCSPCYAYRWADVGREDPRLRAMTRARKKYLKAYWERRRKHMRVAKAMGVAWKIYLARLPDGVRSPLGSGQGLPYARGTSETT